MRDLYSLENISCLDYCSLKYLTKIYFDLERWIPGFSCLLGHNTAAVCLRVEVGVFAVKSSYHSKAFEDLHFRQNIKPKEYSIKCLHLNFIIDFNSTTVWQKEIVMKQGLLLERSKFLVIVWILRHYLNFVKNLSAKWSVWIDLKNYH